VPQEGRLPLDFCGEDDAAREFSNIENLDYPDPEIEAAQVVDYVQRAHRSYDPASFLELPKEFCPNAGR